MTSGPADKSQNIQQSPVTIETGKYQAREGEREREREKEGEGEREEEGEREGEGERECMERERRVLKH